MVRNNNEHYYTVAESFGDIAILGGSFNPIHSGHIEMAETAHRQLGLKVVLIPNKTTYYKENKVFAPDEDRLNMLELVASQYPYVYYTDLEIIRGGVTHTVDTIRDFHESDPERTIYFIIGGDSLEWVDKWVEAEELLRTVHFLTAVRGNTDKKRTQEIINRLKKDYPQSRFTILDMDETPISSSDIRQRIENGQSIDGLVPDYIKDYITKNNLYKGE